MTTTRQQEQRAYLLKIKDEMAVPLMDDRPSFDDCSETERQAVALIEQMIMGGAIPRAIELQYKRTSALKKLLAEPVEQAESEPKQAPKIEVHDNEALLPPLPSGVVLPPELSRGSCRWADEYIAFSKQWSPRSFANFHEACGWSMLSTIAKRRIVINMGSPKYTPLFIAVVADSSISAKTEAAKVHLSVLRKAGMEWMLGADSMTPQAMVGDMAIGKVSANYNELSEDDQAIARRDLAYKGQRGWFYEEFGQHMDAMMQKSGGIMAEFKGLIRRMDDCYPDYTRLTVTHKTQKIELPYLSLLACMTIFDLKPHAGADSALWKDGFFARFAFITPDEKGRNRSRFPEGNMESAIPSSLTEPLKQWHETLKDRKVIVTSEYNERKKEFEYDTLYGDFPEQVCTMDSSVADAFYNYNNALLDIVEEQRMEQLAGNYARLHMIALRIAMLCASLENNGHIEMRHWARGQEFAEKARKGLHAMCARLNENGSVQEQRRTEEDIIKYVSLADTWLTSRLLRRRKFKDMEAERFDSMLSTLVKSGELICKKIGRAEYYTAAGNEEKPIPDAQSGGDR